MQDNNGSEAGVGERLLRGSETGAVAHFLSGYENFTSG
jgi:hypothetical protein